MRGFYKLLAVLVAALDVVGAHSAAAYATIQPEMCIEPDIEYPVPCEGDDD